MHIAELMVVVVVVVLYIASCSLAEIIV